MDMDLLRLLSRKPCGICLEYALQNWKRNIKAKNGLYNSRHCKRCEVVEIIHHV